MPHHSELDQRSLALHALVARKVEASPALIEKAQKVVDHWLEVSDPASHIYLQEWKSVLAQGVAASVRLATENSAHANALRQASPMACLLSNQERFAFLREWKQAHASQ